MRKWYWWFYYDRFRNPNSASIGVQVVWKSGRAESGLLRAKKRNSTDLQMDLYHKNNRCPHPTFRWRPLSCWSLNSTSVTNIIKISGSLLYPKSYGPWATVYNFKSRHSTSLRAFVYFWKITKTWWDTSIRKIV